MENKIKRKKRKSLIIVDIDGTIIDFKEIDNKIIKEIYGKFRLVLFIDKILWKINSLDLISNNILTLNLRIIFYSLISFIDPIKALKSYNCKYKKLAKAQLNSYLIDNINYLKTLVDEVIFTTNNFHAYCLRETLKAKIIIKNKKRCIQNLFNVQVKYIIGNNFADDILPAKKLNKKYTLLKRNKAVIVYIGNSYIVKKVSNISSYDNFNEFVLSLKSSL